jgi:repressor LexA
VRKQLQANRGDIVVAMINDEATVKRYYPEGDSIRFQPANAAMQPIIVKKRDFKTVNIIGLVVGVYRKMRA